MSFGDDTLHPDNDYYSERNRIAREVDRAWYEEIAKRLPQIKVQSFCGASSTIAWLFRQVEIPADVAELAAKLKELEKCSTS